MHAKRETKKKKKKKKKKKSDLNPAIYSVNGDYSLVTSRCDVK